MSVVFALITMGCCLLLSISFNCLLMRSMYKAHKDECMRLMCKDASEYKAMTEDVKREPVESAHSKAIREWREKAEFRQSRNLHGTNPQGGFFRGKR